MDTEKILAELKEVLERREKYDADRTRLAEMAEGARRSGRLEDKVAYAELKRKIETKE